MKFAKYFDHTNLKADASREDIKKLCLEAKKYGFMSVCVNPFYVPIAKKLLEGSDVKITTVVGFPLGQNTPAIKRKEAIDAVNNGADEIDMVQNISMAKSHDFDYIEREVRLIKKGIGNKVLKVILENCLLTEEEIYFCSVACLKGGADFVKTSTGFSKSGAKASDVALMKKAVGGKICIKAAGGIKTATDFQQMIKAGATRIGSSNSVAILEDFLKIR